MCTTSYSQHAGLTGSTNPLISLFLQNHGPIMFSVSRMCAALHEKDRCLIHKSEKSTLMARVSHRCSAPCINQILQREYAQNGHTQLLLLRVSKTLTAPKKDTVFFLQEIVMSQHSSKSGNIVQSQHIPLHS
jgi:hypothetical protein